MSLSSGSNLMPFDLHEAVITLFPANADGSLAGSAVWWGGLANSLKVRSELEGVIMAASGDSYASEHHVDERHSIEISKSWFIRKSDGSDFTLQRNQLYVLQMTWNSGNCWYQRNYFGVTAQSLQQDTIGTLQTINSLTFRAQYFTKAGGMGSSQVYVPTVTAGESESIPFFREELFLPGDYFLGRYIWGKTLTGVSASAICWAGQGTDVVIGLEVNGVMTSYAITLAMGTANTDVTDTVNLAGLNIPPGQSVRWKVISGPSDPANAPWHGAVVMQVVAS